MSGIEHDVDQEHAAWRRPHPTTRAPPRQRLRGRSRATTCSVPRRGADGVPTGEAADRLTRDGRNELPEPPQPSTLRRLLSRFRDVLIYILVAAAVLQALTGDWVDFAVIVVVIVATGLVGFVQDGIMRRAPRSPTEQVLSSRAVAVILVPSVAIGAATLAVFLLFTDAPFMNTWFDSTLIGPYGWGLTAGIAALVYVVIEAAKAVLRRLGDATRHRS